MEAKKNIKVGDIVKIINPWANYPNFGEQAKLMNLRHFESYSEKPQGWNVWVVTVIKEHIEDIGLIYWVRLIVSSDKKNEEKEIIRDFLLKENAFDIIIEKEIKEKVKKEKDGFSKKSYIQKLENIQKIKHSIKEEEKLEKKYYHQVTISFVFEGKLVGENKTLCFYSNFKELSIQTIRGLVEEKKEFIIDKHLVYFNNNQST